MTSDRMATESALPLVVMEPPDDHSRALWRQALSVMRQLEGDWTLVGGLMVQLHCHRWGGNHTRTTVDIDLLADSRRRPSATERIATRLQELGFAPDPEALLLDPPTAFRFERGRVVVDVLAPDHTGPRNPPKSVGGFFTIEAAGGTQALARTERLKVRLEDIEEEVRCPAILGAILMKARVLSRAARPQDREDLLALLGCVQEPLALAAQIKRTERAWLRRAGPALRLDELELDSAFRDDQIGRIVAAHRLLAGPPNGSRQPA